MVMIHENQIFMMTRSLSDFSAAIYTESVGKGTDTYGTAGTSTCNLKSK
jgi:hypothetical protein